MTAFELSCDQWVSALFEAYDTDNDGCLDEADVSLLLHDSLQAQLSYGVDALIDATDAHVLGGYCRPAALDPELHSVHQVGTILYICVCVCCVCVCERWNHLFLLLVQAHYLLYRPADAPSAYDLSDPRLLDYLHFSLNGAGNEPLNGRLPGPLVDATNVLQTKASRY